LTSYSSFRLSTLHALLNTQFGLQADELLYLKRGFNDTYRVSCNNQFSILRVYRAGRRSLEEIRAEVKLLLYLNKNGAAVSVPLPGLNDVYVHPIPAPEGMRYAVLFSFAPGESIRKPSISQCSQSGRALARIHQLGMESDAGKMSWNYTPADLFVQVRQAVSDTLQAYPESMAWLDRFEQVFLEQTKSLTLSSGICHGDIQPENFYFSSEAVTFIDFDFAGPGPLLYDLGAYTWYDHKGKTKEMREAFYEGYSSILPLSPEELNLIPLFGALRGFFLMGMWVAFMDGDSNPIWGAEQVHAFVGKLTAWVNDTCRLRV
jgi:Ser/Thr protein kinase RdoA (MazF antagonist)